MSADDLVWAAGMFEGEGSIMIGTYRSPKGEDVYALHCKIPSTDYDIIAFFSEHWPKSCITQEVRANRQASAQLDTIG